MRITRKLGDIKISIELTQEELRLAYEEQFESDHDEEENRGLVQLNTLSEGDIFKIGEHDFIVLRQDGDCTMVISKGLMAKNMLFDDYTMDYKKSHLKCFIEERIQPVIEAVVGTDNILEHTVDLVSVDMQHEFKPVKCKVRPITFDEARKYNDLLVATDIGDWWWTCTPWSVKGRGLDHSLAVVSPSGIIHNFICNVCTGVRPFCILKSNIFVSKGE